MWTGVLLHTAGNLYLFHVFEDLTLDTGNTPFYAGETGAVFALWGATLIVLFLNLVGLANTFLSFFKN